jgi:hypothetical protein
MNYIFRGAFWAGVVNIRVCSAGYTQFHKIVARVIVYVCSTTTPRGFYTPPGSETFGLTLELGCVSRTPKSVAGFRDKREPCS